MRCMTAIEASYRHGHRSLNVHRILLRATKNDTKGHDKPRDLRDTDAASSLASPSLPAVAEPRGLLLTGKRTSQVE